MPEALFLRAVLGILITSILWDRGRFLVPLSCPLYSQRIIPVLSTLYHFEMMHVKNKYILCGTVDDSLSHPFIR